MSWDKGLTSGVKALGRPMVMCVGNEIRDATAGKRIRRVEGALGDALIAEADKQTALAKHTGPAPAKVGGQVQN